MKLIVSFNLIDVIVYRLKDDIAKTLISYCLGGSISTHKPRIYKPPQLPPTTDLNNKKKFAFLSTETIPDYRPVELHDMSEKSQKTSSNQSTKFQQLQQKFGNVAIQVGGT